MEERLTVEATSDRLRLPGGGPYAYARRRTREVRVGDVGIGGDNPIRIQSMTTARTLDTEATVAQTVRLVDAGCELVRITAPTVEDAANLREIRARLRALGIRVPLIADIHFNPRAALEAARWVEKVRINPGNYADARLFARREYTDEEYAQEIERVEARLLPLIRHCREHGVAMRIGTNHGSLSDRIVSRFGDTPEGMVESALEFVRICERHGYREIVLSMKASNPKVMIQAYRLLAARMKAEGMDYPFHLGVTEAGSGVEARVKSAAGIGALLDDGIGDTIRVSLAEEPEAEIPIARRLADLYTGPSAAARLAPVRLAPALAPPEARDPFAYRRRQSRPVRIGRTLVGGGAPRVVADVTRAGSDPSLLDRLFAGGAGPRAWPDLLEVGLADVDGPAAAERLGAIRSGRAARSRGAPGVAAIPAHRAADLGPAVAALADALKLVVGDGPLPRPLPGAGRGEGSPLHRGPKVPGRGEGGQGVRSVLASVHDAVAVARERRLPIWIEAETGAVTLPPAHSPRAESGFGGEVDWEGAAERLLALADEAEAAGQRAVVLGLRCADHSRTIRATRYLAARLAAAGRDYPLALGAVASGETAPAAPGGSLPLAVPIALGSLLADGIGDVVQVDGSAAGLDEGAEARLAFDCLQAAGARSFKAEIVACPSCGRTLFDLQSTTERIKARTGHLVGVKIAVMGCVVNGPGELADADFGYMGGAPGRVSLYVGRECVEKNVPAEEADERLIALIKARGRWVDPPA